VPMDAPPAHSAGADTPELAIVREINNHRRARGLAALRPARRLARLARSHTRDMLRHDRFSHDSADGTPFSQRMRRAGFHTGGETIAWMSVSSDCRAPAIVRYWLESPPHARELLNSRYRRVGVGRLPGAMGAERGIAVTADLA
jgi:uncharacterized protein YkwD